MNNMNTILNLTNCFVITPLSASYIYCISYDVYNVYISKELSYPRPFSYKLFINPGLFIGGLIGLTGYMIGIPICDNIHKLKFN